MVTHAMAEVDLGVGEAGGRVESWEEPATHFHGLLEQVAFVPGELWVRLLQGFSSKVASKETATNYK